MDKRKTGTKEQILKTAVRLFSEKGIEGGSIRDIVREVGITPGAFYNHFESKEALLPAIWQWYQKKIIEPAENMINLEEMIDSLGVIRFFDTLIDFMFETEHDEELFAFSKLIAIEQHRNEGAAKIAYRSREKSRKLLEEIFIIMARKGLIRTEEPERMAAFLGYGLTGFSVDYYHYRYVQKLAPKEIAEKQKAFVRQFCSDFL